MNEIQYQTETTGNGYLRVTNQLDHPLTDANGNVPLHRLVLFESLGQPQASACHWCGYILPWKSSLTHAQILVVNADHLDGDRSNNDPSNLVPACGWCNVNRSWAEEYAEFLANWRKWMKDVPPNYRPNIRQIAREFGLEIRRPTRIVRESLLPRRPLILPQGPRQLGGRPYKVEQILKRDLCPFLAECPSSGEGKNEMARRLVYWLCIQTNPIDASLHTCKRAIRILVDTKVLIVSNEKYIPA